MLDAGKSLCSLLKMVFSAFPLEAATTPQEIKTLYRSVQDLIQKHLAAVTTPQISLEPSNANSIISFALFVLNALAEVQKNFIDPFIGLLLRVLQRLARDMGSTAGSVRQVCLHNFVIFFTLRNVLSIHQHILLQAICIFYLLYFSFHLLSITLMAVGNLSIIN
jgi:hypothetical protein